MDYHELEKMTVGNLRDMLKEKEPERKGLSGMKKGDLVDALAPLLGIEKPHKVVVGLDKASIKAEMRRFKAKRAEALDAGDHGALADARNHLRTLRRQLRRATRMAG